MKIFNIYYALPVVLQNVMVNCYGFYLHRKRYGALQKKMSKILRDNENLSFEEYENKQLESLKNILKHCSENVPYYRKLFQKTKFSPEVIETLKDLNKIPLLEKREVLENPVDFIAQNIKRADMFLEETSGTSGSPLKVMWHKKFYSWIYALYEARIIASAGLNINDRRANLSGKPLVNRSRKKPPFWKYNIAEKQLYLSGYHLNIENMPFYIHELQRFKPKYIVGYPSSILLVAKYLLESKDEINSISAIITSSEYLSPITRAAIEDGFKCKVHDNYGSVEWVASITECKEGKLHINPEIGIIEIIDKDGNPAHRGQSGEMVCTGLLNFAMPFIRYKTGDIGAFPETDKVCNCGRKTPLFKLLEGRKMSFLSLPDGTHVGGAALSTAFHAKNIIESQIIQEAIKSVTIKLVVAREFSDCDREYLISELKKRISPLIIKCKCVDFIPHGKGGKKPWIVNNIMLNNG